ncbi:MAG: ATP-binding protein [Deltaproteobacteria bacterium]|nr:ATP-binding protein [Deltaproteobacteria bacterium]
MDTPFLIVSDDRQSRDLICAGLRKGRYEPVGADSALEGMGRFRDLRPSIALVDFDMPGGQELIASIISENPTMQIIVLCAAQKLDQAMGALKTSTADFLLRPVQPADIEMALRRAENVLALQTRLMQTMDNLAALSEKKAAEMVATERFLAIRQIVDRMSAFIAQVANDVHGGVKYFNELPYFVSIHSPDCKVLAANPTYIRNLGYRIHGNSWEIYSGKRATRDNCPVARTLRNEDIMETRALVRYKSGAKVPVIVHTAPIFSDDGDVVLVLEIFAGSKEIERIAEEVRTTQQRYQQLFDSVPIQIAAVDRRLRITAINRRFKEDFGRPVGQNFFDVLRPGKFPAFRDPIAQTLKDGLPHQGELVLTDRNGQQYNMMAGTAPIKTLAGKLIQVLITFTDVTRLRQLKDNLSSLGMMIGTISHDLKGCLTGLDAGLYLIDTGFYRDQPGRIEEGLEVVKLMVERVRKQVQNILFYTKERKLEIRQTNVEQFAADVAANVDQRIRGANITFQCEFETDLGEIEIDPDLVRSTLINILENAMEACIEDRSSKSYRITFRVSRKDNEIHFDVIDNGSGMNENQMKNMFTMFFTTKGSKGTGLGLFIANKTVQRHGGRITVDSLPGVGTTFSIRLPHRVPSAV